MWKLWLILLCAQSIWAEDVFPEQMFIKKRTDKIYRRYYLIKRLKPSIDILKHENIRKLIPFEKLDSTLFCQEPMQKMIESLIERQTLDPLFEFWNTFKAYRHLYSNPFVNEFIELVYYIFNSLDSGSYKRVKSLSGEQKLRQIDRHVNAIMYGEKYCCRADTKELEEVSTDAVAKRFFIIKRLSKSVQFLDYIQKNTKHPFKNKSIHRTTEDETGLLSEIEHFSHERVRECVEQICKRKSLEPLLKVCREFKQYRFAQDDSFLQEVLMNIFLVYKSLLFKDLSSQTEQVVMTEMNQVLEIYENLDSLPLDETLEAIDLVTDKLIAIQAFENQRKTSYMSWVVPGVACLCAFGMGAYFL